MKFFFICLLQNSGHILKLDEEFCVLQIMKITDFIHQNQIIFLAFNGPFSKHIVFSNTKQRLRKTSRSFCD